MLRVIARDPEAPDHDEQRPVHRRSGDGPVTPKGIQRAFWPSSSAAWNMTRSVFRICPIKHPKTNSMDRP